MAKKKDRFLPPLWLPDLVLPRTTEEVARYIGAKQKPPSVASSSAGVAEKEVIN